MREHPAHEACHAGGFGGPPPENFYIFSFLILNLMQSVSKWKLGIIHLVFKRLTISVADLGLDRGGFQSEELKTSARVSAREF